MHIITIIKAIHNVYNGITFTTSKLHILPLMEVCMKKRKQDFEILFCQREIQGRLSLLISFCRLSCTLSLSQPQL